MTKFPPLSHADTSDEAEVPAAYQQKTQNRRISLCLLHVTSPRHAWSLCSGLGGANPDGGYAWYAGI
jgi:hypothetical protein